MKFLVLVVVCVCISKTTTLTIDKSKNSHKFTNAIPLPQKGETYYHTTGPQAQEYVPIQIMHKPMYVAQQPTMFIIAQPAYVHPNVIYGGSPGMQQLLNYFHNNPQAKYQLLYGNYQSTQQQTPQTYIPHQQPIGSSSIATYQYVQPNPIYSNYNHLLSAPSHINYNHLPYPTNHISNHLGNHIIHPVQPQYHLAQMAHQHHQYTAPIRSIPSIPPVITGLENFTPEQQAQIKAHLGNHLGAHVVTPSTTTPQQPTAAQTQQQIQYTTQPAQTQEKNYPTTSSSFTPSVLYRTQYTKGK